MKGINVHPMPRACSKRQVLYPTNWEEVLPGTMEEIKITIVNDYVTGSKRERDEVTAVTPCAKRSRHASFNYSTPKSASARVWATQSELSEKHPHFLALEDPELEEYDDSLLEPSDNEDDSELNLTEDQMDSLLNDDDSCCAAEHLQMYPEITNFLVTFTPLESDNEGENGGDAPCKTLDVSDPLSKETECEGDVNNYAAMPPSPGPSAIDPAEVTAQNQSSVCNVKSPHEFLTAKPVTDLDLPTPLSDIKEVSTSLLPSSCSPKHPMQPSISLSRVEVTVDWTEDPDLAFDCDIDNVLAVCPEDASSEDEDIGVKSATIMIKGLPKVDHLPAEPEPQKVALPSTASSIVTPKSKLNTKSSVTDQNAESQKPSEAEETKGMPKVESSSRSTDPTQCAVHSQAKIMAPSGSSLQGPEKEKTPFVVPALPRTCFREFLLDSELETRKNIYCNKVWMHIGQGECNLEDPVYEMASLWNQISREGRNWQHPSDFTKRNHPRLGRKPSKRFTLDQWVTENGGPTERFKNFPNTFQRSPIPNTLPFSSS